MLCVCVCVCACVRVRVCVELKLEVGIGRYRSVFGNTAAALWQHCRHTCCCDYTMSAVRFASTFQYIQL